MLKKRRSEIHWSRVRAPPAPRQGCFSRSGFEIHRLIIVYEGSCRSGCLSPRLAYRFECFGRGDGENGLAGQLRLPLGVRGRRVEHVGPR
jgi:hypothetical protein